jgi:hypothetical protein
MQNTTTTYGSTAARRGATAPWGRRLGWRYGNPEFHLKALVVFLFVGLFPLIAYVFNGFAAPAWPKAYPFFAVLWTLFMALAYPIWAWGEARAFETWTATLDPAQREAAQARQAVRAWNARLFWFGTLAAYGVVAVMAVATR